MDPEVRKLLGALERKLTEVSLSINQSASELGGKIVGLEGRVGGVEHRVAAADKHAQYSLWAVGVLFTLGVWMLTVVHDVKSEQIDTRLGLNELTAAQKQTTEQLQATTEQLQKVSDVQADIAARLTSIENSLQAALRDSSVPRQENAPQAPTQGSPPEEQHNENRTNEPGQENELGIEGEPVEEGALHNLLVAGIEVSAAPVGMTVSSVIGKRVRLFPDVKSRAVLHRAEAIDINGAEVFAFTNRRAQIAYQDRRVWVDRYKIKTEPDLQQYEDLPLCEERSAGPGVGASSATGRVRGLCR